jgi:hypothetical protein
MDLILRRVRLDVHARSHHTDEDARQCQRNSYYCSHVASCADALPFQQLRGFEQKVCDLAHTIVISIISWRPRPCSRRSIRRTLRATRQAHQMSAFGTKRFQPHPRMAQSGHQLATCHSAFLHYRVGCFVGFHSRASFCASAICAGVMRRAIRSRKVAAPSLPCAADKVNHTYARTLSSGTPRPLS